MNLVSETTSTVVRWVVSPHAARCDAQIAATAKAWYEGLAAQRKLTTAAGKLAAKYSNAALGEIAIRKQGDATVFDFGEWKATGIAGIELVAGTAGDKRTLTLRDAQHEYVFVEK